MKFIKQLDSARITASLKTRTYSNVRMPQCGQFLEELSRDGILPDAPSRSAGTEWGEVSDRTVRMKLSTSPMLSSHIAEWVVEGTNSSLQRFHALFNRFAVFEGQETEELAVAHQYHEQLNPKLWTSEGELDGDVAEKLKENAAAFFDFLNMEDLELEDVVITGSSANYNWTEHSDIDLHLIVDMKAVEQQFGPLAVEYFDAKKRLWNDLHDIQIKGIPVEFYVEDASEQHVSTGIYSLAKDRWNVEPQFKEPDVNDAAVVAKAKHLIHEIQDVLTSNKASAIEDMVDKIKNMRQAGLSEAGEFSTKNLAFKILRRDGWLQKLYDCKTRVYDRQLSIEEEEWSCCK